MTVPYCGLPPLPAALWHRFNLDPALLAILAALLALHVYAAGRSRERAFAMAGWATATIAFISPLCALSVALFSARVGQHMLLVLIAAPLIALALPPPRHHRDGHRRPLLWSSVGCFFAALWFWHMPRPYDATFASTPVYWSMHVTLFGSAIWLWFELLQHAQADTAEALAAGMVSFMQMGLLGAVLTLASHPLFSWHLTTTWSWGLSPLQDQQLGGALMWVPGVALFLWSTLRSLKRLRQLSSHASWS